MVFGSFSLQNKVSKTMAQFTAKSEALRIGAEPHSFDIGQRP